MLQCKMMSSGMIKCDVCACGGEAQERKNEKSESAETL
jgi:hypothetical protein